MGIDDDYRNGVKTVFEIGMCGRAELTVMPEDTAAALKSGGIESFSTPMLVALMESAACNALENVLPRGVTTVGTSINVSHTSATPVGMRVWAEAKLSDFSGKGISFFIEAFDEKGKIGHAAHKRLAVVEQKFMDRVNEKLQNSQNFDT